MRRTVCCRSVQNILHDVQAAAESRSLVATSSFAQRRMFLMALHEELRRNREVIMRANRRDCDVFGRQQQQRGTPSVTIPPIMPSAAATTVAAMTANAAAGIGAGRNGKGSHMMQRDRKPSATAPATGASSAPSSPSSFATVSHTVDAPTSATGVAAGSNSSNRSTASSTTAPALPRRRSPLEYVAKTTLSSSAGPRDTAAHNHAMATASAGLGGSNSVASPSSSLPSTAAPNTGSHTASRQDGKTTTESGEGSSTLAAALADVAAASGNGGGGASPSSSVPLSPSAARATSTAPPNAFNRISYAVRESVTHTEAGGGGGHLLLTSDHHLLISPLRLDKLHATLDYLLCQPDPIAVPASCWLHPYAERGSGVLAERLRDGTSTSSAAASTEAPTTPAPHSIAMPAETALSDACRSGSYTCPGRCTRRTDQLEVFELPVPLGMVGILSRFRPRISLDAVAMGIFAGNTMLVDGGVSLCYTNIALVTLVRRALAAAGLPPTAVVCVESYDTAHRSTSEWLQLSDYVDLAVVCGPPKLYQFASRHSTIPLMRATGQFSSVYVDQSASFEVALEVILNSKFQKLGAANAVTTIIVHRDFPRYTELLMALSAGGAVLLGDVAAQERVPDCVVELASEEEYEGLSQYGIRDATRTMCVKTVDSLAQALFFLESFGSKQSDCVVATDPEVCATYCRQVDTAVALVNASTRLSSGVPLGCGTDFAISTSKAHCRGPLTLNMMTTRKLVARSLSLHHGALR